MNIIDVSFERLGRKNRVKKTQKHTFVNIKPIYFTQPLSFFFF